MNKETISKLQIKNLEKLVSNQEKINSAQKLIINSYRKLCNSYKRLCRSNQKMLIFFILIWFWLGYWYGTTGSFRMGFVVWIFTFILIIMNELISRKKDGITRIY